MKSTALTGAVILATCLGKHLADRAPRHLSAAIWAGFSTRVRFLLHLSPVAFLVLFASGHDVGPSLTACSRDHAAIVSRHAIPTLLLSVHCASAGHL
jgi:hypothetical protein